MLKLNNSIPDTPDEEMSYEDVFHRKMDLLAAESQMKSAFVGIDTTMDLLYTLEGLGNAIDEYGISVSMMKAVDPIGELCPHMSLEDYSSLPEVPTKGAVSQNALSGISNVVNAVVMKVPADLDAIVTASQKVIDNAHDVIRDTFKILNQQRHDLVASGIAAHHLTRDIVPISISDAPALLKFNKTFAGAAENITSDKVQGVLDDLSTMILSVDVSDEQLQSCKNKVDDIFRDILGIKSGINNYYSLQVKESEVFGEIVTTSPVVRANKSNVTLTAHGYKSVEDILSSIDSATNQCKRYMDEKVNNNAILKGIVESLSAIKNDLTTDIDLDQDAVKRRKLTTMAYAEFVIGIVSVLNAKSHFIVDACNTISTVSKSALNIDIESE